MGVFRVLDMLVFTKFQTDVYCGILFDTYLSLFNSGYPYLNKSLYIVEKQKERDVPSIQFNISDPASTSTSFSTGLAFSGIFGKSRVILIVCDFSIWVVQGTLYNSYGYPSDLSHICILLGPQISAPPLLHFLDQSILIVRKCRQGTDYSSRLDPL